MTDLTEIPTSLIAGDSASWVISLNDYPASAGWALSYTLLNASAKIEISSISSGDSHFVSLTAAETAVFPSGKYKYRASVSNATFRYTVGSGDIEILRDFETQTRHDGRTFAEICLDNIESVISGKATADNLQYTINGRSLAKYSWSDLLEARGFFKSEVNREQKKLTGRGSNKVLVRFV